MSKPATRKPRTNKRKSNRDIVGASMAVGIGSAAIAAALLYVTRPRKDPSVTEHREGGDHAIKSRFVDET